MNGIIHKLCLVLSCLCLFGIVFSFKFQELSTSISSSNTSVENVEELFLLNKKQVELRYAAQMESVSGLILYFRVNLDKGTSNNKLNSMADDEYGFLHCTIQNAYGEIIDEVQVEIKDILKLQKKDKLVGTSFDFNIGKYNDQVLSFIITAKDVPSNISVSLLGNIKKEKMVINNYGRSYQKYPLYQVKVAVYENKYIWDLLLILLFALLATILTKEYKDNGEMA